MRNNIEITKLSREEKLKVMEAIWTDLSHEEEQLTSHHLTGTIRRCKKQSIGLVLEKKRLLTGWTRKKNSENDQNGNQNSLFRSG